MAKKIGNSSYVLKNPPSFLSTAAIVGEVESEGPLGQYFDLSVDEYWDEDSWEKAETKMFEMSIRKALEKIKLQPQDMDVMLGGDLLNQIISASFAARQLEIPYLGLYGACSTMTESLIIGSSLIDGEFIDRAACVTGSHFSTAERQYRTPNELGNQTPPTSQRTVTGAGASIIGSGGTGPFITSFTIGKVVDYGIKDAANMGAAMAPSAVDTIEIHLNDTGRVPSYYDMIITGDLGKLGSEILVEKLKEKDIDISHNHNDCGLMVFDIENQKVDCGGSGCGCAAVTLNAFLIRKMLEGKINRILLVATGALLSTTSSLQGESIPGVAHAVCIERSLSV
ncbi:stage V sporulation protein AD [Clostridia bacterium OttesenSCG-928-F22]|nr:stage V sporulation protein AD [Clostridia bacterium OttesenSCG-928-F22]